MHPYFPPIQRSADNHVLDPHVTISWPARPRLRLLLTCKHVAVLKAHVHLILRPRLH